MMHRERGEQSVLGHRRPCVYVVDGSRIALAEKRQAGGSGAAEGGWEGQPRAHEVSQVGRQIGRAGGRRGRAVHGEHYGVVTV